MDINEENHDESVEDPTDEVETTDAAFDDTTEALDLDDDTTPESADPAETDEPDAASTEPIDDATDASRGTDDTDLDPIPDPHELFGDDLDDVTDSESNPTIDDPAEPIYSTTASGAVPPPPPPIPDTGLVRDPYARLGGIASGIAHRYGWDVSITRLVFLLALFLSGGTMIPVYLIAWLVIPRATVWPPTPVRGRRGGLTMRELGIGLAAAGALIFVAVGTGSAGSVLVPLLLIGGGMFLLFQAPRDEMALAPSSGVAAPTPPSIPMSPTPPPPPMQQAVQPRPRGRRVLGFLLGGFLLILLLAVIAVPLLLIALIADGDVDINVDDERRFTPVSAAEFPFVSDTDAGRIVIDLTDLTNDDFDGRSAPAVIDIELGAGEVVLVVPDGLDADIDAEVTVGEVTLFGDVDSGFDSEVVVDVDDEVLDIRIDLFAGDVTVQRGNATVSSVIESIGSDG